MFSIQVLSIFGPLGHLIRKNFQVFDYTPGRNPSQSGPLLSILTLIIETLIKLTEDLRNF